MLDWFHNQEFFACEPKKVGARCAARGGIDARIREAGIVGGEIAGATDEDAVHDPPPRRAPDAIAPDGSEVRVLARLAGGSMAHFRLPAGAVSRAVVHRTVEELWYFVGGRGRMWRHDGEREEIVEARPGVSISIPVGTALPVPGRRRRAARGGRRHHAAVAGPGRGRCRPTASWRRRRSRAGSPLPAGRGQLFAAVSGLPVSSRLFRLERTFGQPLETASIVLELSRSISWVIVSLRRLPGWRCRRCSG